MAIEVGDIVDGRYRLLDTLGEGAAGKVFRAEDRGQNNRFVALKILHAKDPRWENFFRREFEVLSRLHHPNLVRVYDYGPLPEESSYYFTQELVVGKPLLDFVAGKKVDEVAGLFIEICRALEFIHGHGVLHRDLKPANILVQENGEPGERVRVLDFGLWRELDPTPQHKARWAGTPPYLASEVLRGHGHSISADLYAVGVTLFQAVTRKLPHGRGTPPELLAARKQPAPDLTGVVAQPLADLIRKLLDEDPQRRQATAAEVAASLSVLVPGHLLAMPITLGRARLVGRDAEAARLRAAMAAVREGAPNAPRLFVVEGPDGVGKSRLVAELKAEVQLEGGRAAIGTCIEDVRWEYRPVREMVRALVPVGDLGQLSPAGRLVVERLCPDLADASDTPLPDVADDDSFQEAAADLFEDLMRQRAGVLIVEDVPWADPKTVGLLNAILRRAREARILVVVTAGPLKDYGPVPEALLRTAHGGVERLTLGPLVRADVDRLCNGLLGTTSVPATLVDTVMAHAKGSPLLVEEMISLLIDRNDIKRGAKGWMLAEFESPTIAAGPLLGVLADRLGRLDDNERCALSALAVFNRPAGAKILAAISGLERAEVKDALATAEEAGLIHVVDDNGGRPKVAFLHPHIRDVLIDELREGEVLEEWHQICAEVLEERAEGHPKGPLAETLAFHYEAAQDAPAALMWLISASEYALSEPNFDDALSFARRAGRQLIPSSATLAAELKVDRLIGQSLLLKGDTAEARAFLESAVARQVEGEALDVWADLHIWLGRAYNALGHLQQGRRAIDRAFERVAEAKEPLAFARLLIARGEMQQQVFPKAAVDDARNALRKMQEPRDVSDELSAFAVLTVASYWAGKRSDAREFARHRVMLAEREERVADQISALRDLARLLSVTGDRLLARTHLNKAVNLARECDHHTETARLKKLLGEQLFISGAYNQAITRFQEAATASAQFGLEAERADALRFLGESYRAKGDYARSVDHLTSAMETLSKTGPLASEIIARCAYAQALISHQDFEKAEAVLADADSRVPDELVVGKAAVLSATAALACAVGDFTQSRDTAVRSIALYRQCEDKFGLGEALVVYAQLLLRFRLSSRALRLARRAETIFADLDAKGQLKRIQPLINAARGLAEQDAQA